MPVASCITVAVVSRYCRIYIACVVIAFLFNFQAVVNVTCDVCNKRCLVPIYRGCFNCKLPRRDGVP